LPGDVVGYLGDFPTIVKTVEKIHCNPDPNPFPAVILHYEKFSTGHRYSWLIFMMGKM
jgi:hypothetical protein